MLFGDRQEMRRLYPEAPSPKIWRKYTDGFKSKKNEQGIRVDADDPNIAKKMFHLFFPP